MDRIRRVWSAIVAFWLVPTPDPVRQDDDDADDPTYVNAW